MVNGEVSETMYLTTHRAYPFVPKMLVASSNVRMHSAGSKNFENSHSYTDSEKSQSLQPLVPHNVSISPTGHILLTLDTLSRSGGGGGRDLFAWGANYDYQLGNGKRGSLASPTALQRPDGSRLMLIRRTAKEVKDLAGRIWGRRVQVEQRAVAGYGNSFVYWKIC
jgi:hypothetical protein